MAQSEDRMEALGASEVNARTGSRSFVTMEQAKIEFNINETGLHIVANEDGWKTLALWCGRMASDEVDHHDTPRWRHSAYELDPEVAPEDMLVDGSILTSFWGLGASLDSEMDVFFHRSDVIGPEYWRDLGVPSGTSPGTHAFASLMYWALESLRGLPVEQVVARLGEPVVHVDELAYFLPDDGLRELISPIDSADVLVELGFERGKVDCANWVFRNELDAWPEASK